MKDDHAAKIAKLNATTNTIALTYSCRNQHYGETCENGTKNSIKLTGYNDNAREILTKGVDIKITLTLGMNIC